MKNRHKNFSLCFTDIIPLYPVLYIFKQNLKKWILNNVYNFIMIQNKCLTEANFTESLNLHRIFTLISPIIRNTNNLNDSFSSLFHFTRLNLFYFLVFNLVILSHIYFYVQKCSWFSVVSYFVLVYYKSFVKKINKAQPIANFLTKELYTVLE